MIRRIITPTLLLCIAATAIADWPQWRGPNGNGVALDAKIPKTWSESENIQWRRPIPGRGWSSPVIEGDRIWLTSAHETPASEEDTKRRLESNTGSQPLTVLSQVRIHAVCLNAQTGEILHDIEALRKDDPQWVHITNSYASPTPILSKGRLYIQNGSYGSACIDASTGKVIWRNQDLHVMHENGPGGSPALWRDKLIFHMDGSDQQFIAAIDIKTGKTAWQTPRSGEMNQNPQLQKSYGTPVVASIKGQDVVISPAADWLYAYDPLTGKELWKLSYGGLGFSIVPKPVIGNGVIYIGTSYMKPRLMAIDVRAEKPEVLWTHQRGVPAISSPILVGTEIYFVSDKGGIVTCLDAMSGEELWRQRFGGNHSASPTLAGQHLLFHSKEGTTIVLKPGREYKLLAKNKLEGAHHASAAIDGNALFLRTEAALYKIQ